ncbi:preprotein translocase subunit YajC [Mycobacterium colombiense]|uniref:preprotein translocase subunit YajC n=1 Tax=Mycobacterium colombiense TaxID=339268 RepID=UPI00200A7E59|nr:preprotein translocase subunit YajC [Mycobacterium colombiense]MCK8643181.1 preprotein translocase subunit YajC [Mycobacterium colombiense]
MQSLILFLPFLLIMGGFMYLASRRQKRAMQATIDLHESLRPGDRVHTTSGLQATVVAITDENVDLEISPGVVTTWMKLAIRDRILPDDEDLADGEDAADEGSISKDL